MIKQKKTVKRPGTTDNNASISIIMFMISLIILIPSYSEASSGLGTIHLASSTINSSLGEHVQVKLSYFSKSEKDTRINISYELLDEGTRYDLLESGKKIYILNAPYPSEPVLDNIVLPGVTKTPSSSQGKSWVALDTLKTYAEIKSVYLFVSIPTSIVHTNPYRIKITATTVSEETEFPKNKKKVQSAQSISQQVEQTITIYNYDAENPRPPIDSDYDGLTDYEEENIYHTDPMKKDTDGDGISDGRELENGTDPNIPDISKKPKIIYDPNNPLSDQHENTIKDESQAIENILDSINENDKNQQKTNSTTILTISKKKNNNNETSTDPTGFLTLNPVSGPMNIYTVIIFIICLITIYKVLKMDIK